MYFASFLVICFYFMTNLLLGAVYSNYKSLAEGREREAGEVGAGNFQCRLVEEHSRSYLITLASLRHLLLDVAPQSFGSVRPSLPR